MSKHNKNTDFINLLEKEIKRLSPSLSLSLKSTDPLGQILEIVRIATDTLIEEKKALEFEYTQLSRESSPRLLNEDSKELRDSKTKILNAQKELSKIQGLLKAKEKRLDAKEQEILSQTSKLSEDRRMFEYEKSELEFKTQELEGNIRSFQEKESTFTISFEKYWQDKESLEKEKDTIHILKQKIEKNYLESEKIKKFTILAEEDLKKEQEILRVERQMYEEKANDLSSKQRYIDKTFTELEREKKIIEIEKKKILNEKDELIKIKQQISDDRLSLLEEHQETEKSRKTNESRMSEARPSVDNSKSRELTKMYEKLKAQIEIFNKETENREIIISSQQQAIHFDTEKISKNYTNLSLIEQSLLRTKSEILEFNQIIMPQIESMFKECVSLLQTFAIRFSEIEGLERKLIEYLNMIGPSENGISPTEKKVKIIEKKSLRRGGNMESHGKIHMENGIRLPSEMEFKDFEDRIKAVEIRERELDFALLDNARMTEYLKKAKNKIRVDKDKVREEKDKIKIQAFQLEQRIKALTIKENEIQSFKIELDKKANLLKIKEKQLDLKIINTRVDEQVLLSDR
ncbi:hypothetical protein SteCoe_30367 [Stentor coeruleus]|uniref:Uncharacterized protein n=1 Tax=Stentor coeruleus TaxID=5963 RepID=A0A1R2B3T9_9CILI|nr:hypothetical protein SteCoe_30367 [Stentor coeruleus]